MANITDPSMVFYADLTKHDGSSFMSDDQYGHLCTITGATWGIQGRLFNGDDYIEMASETVMNFTSGDFSAVFRVRFDNLDVTNFLFSRGLTNTDGYVFMIQETGRPLFETSQNAASQQTYGTAGDFTTGTWYTIGWSRSGANVTLYKDGVDITNTHGTHTNPVTCARTVKIGTVDAKNEKWLKGATSEAVVYNRVLSGLEMQAHHLSMQEKGRYHG